MLLIPCLGRTCLTRTHNYLRPLRQDESIDLPIIATRLHAEDLMTSRQAHTTTLPRTPTRRPRQQAFIQPEPSPRTPVAGEMDDMMGSPIGATELGRKRSLVRPERNRIDRDHPNFHYRQHAQNMTVQPSTTGNDPIVEELAENETIVSDDTEVKRLNGSAPREPRRNLYRQFTPSWKEERSGARYWERQ